MAEYDAEEYTRLCQWEEGLEELKEAYANQPELVDETNSNGHNGLHIAAANHQAEILAWLISVVAPKSLDAQDCDGLTPLMWAVQSRNKEAMRQLVLAGADVHITSQDGTTATDLADVNLKAVLQNAISDQSDTEGKKEEVEEKEKEKQETEEEQREQTPSISIEA